MSAAQYDHKKIEEKWIRKWEEEGLYRVGVEEVGDKRYILVMFPYPSGPAHMGHVANYTLGDVAARYLSRRGFNVLHPMGYDAFGLPAENAAIKSGVQPARWTEQNIELIRRDLKRLGYSYDWSRELSTCDPQYYRWTQWFFLKMYQRGLAYKADASVNWCPSCNTVLANEQVLSNGTCERCETVVIQKWLEQWFFKITEYAERLLQDEELLEDWPERVLTMQENWIGKSYGADVDFILKKTGEKIRIYTTRPDTLYGVTFFLLAPEHPLVDRLTEGTSYREEVELFRERIRGVSKFERTAMEAVKDGCFLGATVINPVNGEEVPVYTANFVMMEYGTGAVMAVPAHDQRDFEFARKFGLDIRLVIQPPGAELDPDRMEEAYVEEGTMVNSGPFNGVPSEEGKQKVIELLEEREWGGRAVNYRLRDWLISRQRYWGAPIPIVYCEKCGTLPVPEDQLPVILPVDLELGPEGQSPLSRDESFFKVSCPGCGGEARRETDTMDTFVDSSWYYFRYCSPHWDEGPFKREEIDYWMPVDQYIGGIEHAVMHLLYSRFFTKVLYDMGLISFKEPFSRLLCQGMVTKDGAKMSKSKGNVVTPEDYVDRLGADTLRLYLLFLAPAEADKDWSDRGVEGAYRFLGRLWRLYHERYLALVEESREDPDKLGEKDRELKRAMHRTIKNVTRDIEEFAFNTAISFIMEMVNAAYKYTEEGPVNVALLREVINTIVSLLSPFTPFITEELWSLLGYETSVHVEPWPVYQEEWVAAERITLVVQVNGKVRDKIEVAVGVDEEEMRKIAISSPKVQRNIEGSEIKKIVVVPGKLVNIVV